MYTHTTIEVYDRWVIVKLGAYLPDPYDSPPSLHTYLINAQYTTTT